MKKSNVVLQAAVASAFLGLAGGVQAGALSMAGNANFASQAFGPTATATTAIQPTAIAYTFNTPGGIVVNNGGSVYLFQRLTGGTFAATPLAAQYALSAGITGIVVASPTLSTDNTTVRIQLNNTSGANVTIGIGGSVTWTPIAGAVSGVNTTLATVGGAVTMQASIGSVAGSSVPNTGTATLADLDNGLSAAQTIASSVSAITATVAASSSFATVAETQRVDLTATSPGSRFTTPAATLSNASNANVVNLGSITFTNVTGTQADLSGNSDYTLATKAAANSLGGTVTGTFKTGSTLQLSETRQCDLAVASGTTTLNTALTTFTSSGYVMPLTGVPYYVCLTVPSTTGAIPLGTPTASFTFTKVVSTDATTTAAGSLYTLANNGSIVDVRNWVPLAATGWSTVLRIINTGNVSAEISGAVITESTGAVGTSVALATLAAGAATTVSASALETALGGATVFTSTARPRIRISGPTNGLEVQTYVFNPNGNFSIIHGKE